MSFDNWNPNSPSGYIDPETVKCGTCDQPPSATRHTQYALCLVESRGEGCGLGEPNNHHVFVYKTPAHESLTVSSVTGKDVEFSFDPKEGAIAYLNIRITRKYDNTVSIVSLSLDKARQVRDLLNQNIS